MGRTNDKTVALLGLGSTLEKLNNYDAACCIFASTFSQFPKSVESTLANSQFVKLGCSQSATTSDLKNRPRTELQVYSKVPVPNSLVQISHT